MQTVTQPSAAANALPIFAPAFYNVASQLINPDEASKHFKTLLFPDRVDWANRRFLDEIALISSFGPKSLPLIWGIRQAVPDMPIIHIDVEGEGSQDARDHRDQLAERLNFDPIVEHATEETKAQVMQDTMQKWGIRAFIRGIRHGQTPERAQHDFVEEWGENITAFNLILDWDEAAVERLVLKLPQSLRHPKFKPGIQSKSGRILAEGEEKTECSLEEFYKRKAAEKLIRLEAAEAELQGLPVHDLPDELIHA